jgi:hypothetical protein
MMGRWGARESLMLAGAFILSLSIAYCSGVKKGQSDERLAQNKVQIRTQDSVSSEDSVRADSARQKAIRLDSTYDVVRTKVRVVRDSVFVRDTVYVSSDLAQVIVTADSTIAAQKRSLALQDTLISSLRVGISLRDQRIDLLEKRSGPRFGLKTGIAIGAVSTVAVVVVAVKVIQAIKK